MYTNKEFLKRVLAGILATVSILPAARAEKKINVPNGESGVIEKSESKSWF